MDGKEGTPEKPTPMEEGIANDKKPLRGNNNNKERQRSFTPKPAAVAARRPALEYTSPPAAAAASMKAMFEDSKCPRSSPAIQQKIDELEKGEKANRDSPYNTNAAIQIDPGGTIFVGRATTMGKPEMAIKENDVGTFTLKVQSTIPKAETEESAAGKD